MSRRQSRASRAAPRRKPPPPRARPADSPFLELGLAARPDLTDDEVRAAWRRIAAASHPDRADGGDPGRFAAAAAAYTELRTRSGRGEALADLREAAPAASGGQAAAAPPPGAQRGAAQRLAARVRRGRPWRLLLRVLAVACVGFIAASASGAAPATPALITGAVTWLALTARHDLAPPASLP